MGVEDFFPVVPEMSIDPSIDPSVISEYGPQIPYDMTPDPNFTYTIPDAVSGFDWSKLGQTALSKLMDPKSLALLAQGVYSQQAGKAQSKSQQQIANQLLQNADPYKDYRQSAEIPFKLSQIPQYLNTQNKQTNLLDAALSKATGGNPVLDALKAKLGGTNALGGDYAEYQNHLKQSYNDPLQYYNSKGYQTIADLFGSQIARRDAAKGRNSQYGTRAVEMQGNFLNNLDKLRSSLNQSAQVAGSMQGNDLGHTLQGISTLGNLDTQQLQGLAGLYGNMNQGLNHLGNVISADKTAGQGASQAAGIYGNAAGMQNYGYLPLMEAVTKSFGG